MTRVEVHVIEHDAVKAIPFDPGDIHPRPRPPSRVTDVRCGEIGIVTEGYPLPCAIMQPPALMSCCVLLRHQGRWPVVMMRASDHRSKVLVGEDLGMGILQPPLPHAAGCLAGHVPLHHDVGVLVARCGAITTEPEMLTLADEKADDPVVARPRCSSRLWR